MTQQKKRSRLKKLLPQTLFGRSMLIMITPVLLLQILVSIFFFDRHWDDMTERLTQATAGEIELALSTIDLNSLYDDDQAPFAQDIDFVHDMKRTLEMRIGFEPNVTLDEKTQDKRFIPTEIDLFEEALDQRLKAPFEIRTNRAEKYYEVLVEIDKGVLRFLFPERRLYTSTSYIFIIWLIASSAILFAIAILFMRNQIRPIRRLAMAADRFGRGIDVPKFKPQGAREVRQAAESFLDMRERIRRQVEQRTAMLSGVSHDLRTPITRMKLQLELMGDSPDVEALHTDLLDMEAMIEGYLAFVKGDQDERHGAIDIGHLVQNVSAKLRRQMLNINENTLETGHIIRLRQNAMERVIANILTNACKYGTQAWVSVYKSGSIIEITIDDDGPGIPEGQREEVFKPFYRLEDSRNPETGGLGLGLSVAQDIIHNHGGKVMLDDSNHGGLRVILQLPIG